MMERLTGRAVRAPSRRAARIGLPRKRRAIAYNSTLPDSTLKGEGRIATQVGYSRLAQFELPISGKPEIGGDPGWGSC